MEDTQIIDLYWQRNEDAILETQMKYEKLCKTIAYNVLNSIDEVEECLNDTYLTAWSLMPNERPEKLGAFVAAITRNLALKRYDYWTAKKRNICLEDSYEELEQCIVSKDNLDNKLSEKELVIQIGKLLKTLKYEDRVIFVRKYWYCDSVSNIERILGCSESKIKSSLFRTRNKLKEYLVREEFLYEKKKYYACAK